MLQLLQTGNALYVLAAVCVLSLVSKFITRNLYKRLIKETDNMTLTKNKYLRTLKQKTENTYRMNQGISNTQVYLEKQLHGYRFMGLTLGGWTGLSNQMTILCFLLGGVGAFAAYWYRSDSYYIVLYGSVGILAGLLCILADSGWNLGEQKMHLLVALQDYLENTMFGRLSKEEPEYEIKIAETPETARNGTRDNVRAARRGGGNNSGKSNVSSNVSSSGNSSGRVNRRETAVEAPAEPNHRRDIDYLKKSLEQIAASREKNRVDENWMKELKPDEVKLIGEILQEYLS